MDELEKIDLIRSRAGVGYKKARDILEEADGDVVQALVMLEEEKREWDEKLQDRGEEIFEYMKGLLKKGKATRIRIKQGDRTVLEFPATLGALGILGTLVSSELAVLGVLGTVAAMAKKYTLEIERETERYGEEGESSVLGQKNEAAQ